MQDPAGLSPSDIRVLVLLAEEQKRTGVKRLSLVDLASRETADARAARHALQRLMMKGWIELARDADASRLGAGCVTDDGLRAAETIPPPEGS
jgi:DNA-binding MarR family transcriptional regulator